MKKILSLILTIIILSSSVANVFATNEQKEEIVYVSTNPNGEILGKYVVNIFDVQKEGEVVDFGKYEKVQNLSNLSDVKYQDGKISINAEKGKLFYQGDNPVGELPWNIELEYLLDGKKLDYREISGKSGKVEIRGKITTNPKANKMYTDYYLAQFSIEVDSKNAIVKEYDDAMLAYNGSVQILNYTILPSKTLNFNIIFDAKSFEMGPFKLSGIPFNMNFELPDLNEFTNNLKQLEDGIKLLNSGANQINFGIGELASNSRLLYENLYKLNSGILQAYDGQNQLSFGTKQFHDGLEQYSGGIASLVSKLGDMGNGLNQLKMGLVSLRDGSEELSFGLEKYGMGISEYTNGVSEIADGHSDFTFGLEKLISEASKLNEGGDRLVEGSDKIYEGLQIFENLEFLENITKDDMIFLGKVIDEILQIWDNAEESVNQIDVDELLARLYLAKDNLLDTINQLEKLNLELNIDDLVKNLGIVDTENEDVKKLLGRIQEISERLTSLRESLNRINSLIDEYTGKYESFEELKENISQKRKELIEKLIPLKDALSKFDGEKTFEILQQISKFRPGYKEFHDGLVEYINGTKQVVDVLENKMLPGSKEINSGLLKLKEGGVKFSEISKLVLGSSQISNGLTQIIEKLDFSDMSEVVKLKNGIDLLVLNHKKLIDGNESLRYGLLEISDGLGKYISGYGKFDDGLGQINFGTTQLSNGTNELASKTDGMSNLAKSQMDEALKIFNKEGFELQSFVSEKNKNIKLVQFVYVSDSITGEPEKEAEEQIVEKSFLEKLLDIIIFWD